MEEYKLNDNYYDIPHIGVGDIDESHTSVAEVPIDDFRLYGSKDISFMDEKKESYDDLLEQIEQLKLKLEGKTVRKRVMLKPSRDDKKQLIRERLRRRLKKKKPEEKK